MSETPGRYRGALDELARVTANAKANRTAANDYGRAAIRKAIGALEKALDGERLYNTPNLGVANEPIYGYLIRSRRTDARLRAGQSPALMLSDRGTLAMAWRSDEGFGWRDATEEDYRAEDLPRVLETIALATERHIDKAKRRSRRFLNIVELSDKVTFILGDDQ